MSHLNQYGHSISFEVSTWFDRTISTDSFDSLAEAQDFMESQKGTEGWRCMNLIVAQRLEIGKTYPDPSQDAFDEALRVLKTAARSRLDDLESEIRRDALSAQEHSRIEIEKAEIEGRRQRDIGK